MRRIRVIPVLQIDNKKLVKTTRFKMPSYVGDPINALRIFNEKEVDEIVVVDIGATKNNKAPDLDLISLLASECFMPLAYGGGITTLSQADALFQSGVEKVILGTSAHRQSQLITEVIQKYGSQSVSVSIDVKVDWLGRQRVFVNSGSTNTDISPVAYAKSMAQAGAGELLLQCIDREGCQQGYDLELIKKVSSSVDIPIVALGGAHSIQDFLTAARQGASGVAAGDMFLFKGPHKAVLINYPTQESLFHNLYSHL